MYSHFCKFNFKQGKGKKKGSFELSTFQKLREKDFKDLLL